MGIYFRDRQWCCSVHALQDREERGHLRPLAMSCVGLQHIIIVFLDEVHGAAKRVLPAARAATNAGGWWLLEPEISSVVAWAPSIPEKDFLQIRWANTNGRTMVPPSGASVS